MAQERWIQAEGVGMKDWETRGREDQIGWSGPCAANPTNGEQRNRDSHTVPVRKCKAVPKPVIDAFFAHTAIPKPPQRKRRSDGF